MPPREGRRAAQAGHSARCAATGRPPLRRGRGRRARGNPRDASFLYRNVDVSPQFSDVLKIDLSDFTCQMKKADQEEEASYGDAASPGSMRAEGPFNPSKMKKSKFSPIEDEYLRQLVNELGTKNWTEIALRIGNRSPRQCRDRYNHYLAPNTNLSDWTRAEDEILIEKYEKMGPKWATLATFFPGRPSVSVRNRCCRLLRLIENGKLNKLHGKEEQASAARNEPEAQAEGSRKMIPGIATFQLPPQLLPMSQIVSPTQEKQPPAHRPLLPTCISLPFPINRANILPTFNQPESLITFFNPIE